MAQSLQLGSSHGGLSRIHWSSGPGSALACGGKGGALTQFHQPPAGREPVAPACGVIGVDRLDEQRPGRRVSTASLVKTFLFIFSPFFPFRFHHLHFPFLFIFFCVPLINSPFFPYFFLDSLFRSANGGTGQRGKWGNSAQTIFQRRWHADRRRPAGAQTSACASMPTTVA